MRRVLIWSAAGFTGVLLTVAMSFPATWMAAMLERQTAGRLTLGDAHGTLWRGSAFIGGAASGSDPIAPLLPGRFSWRISPMVLLGSVDAMLENPTVLSGPVSVMGGWHRWQVSAGTMTIPAQRLSALGAPLNTLQPSGEMLLTWEPLLVTLQNGTIGISGTMHLEMKDMGSRLSPVKPLGSYDLMFDWQGAQAAVALKTLKGPMLLNGSGMMANGRLQFSGTARAEAGQQEKLANLLNLLGLSRRAGNESITVLEFN